jgi:tetratricopeptide (TPR) repeat protein
MRRFLRVLAAALLPLLARAEPDGEFLAIYNLIQEGEALEAGGDLAGAYERYGTARRDLAAFTRAHPGWNPTIVRFRRGYLEDKLGGLQERVPATAPAPPPRPPADERAADLALRAAQLEEQLEAARRQIARLDAGRGELAAERETLTAKLREALAARPADVDPAALRRAEERVTALLKENEVLKAAVDRQMIENAKAATAVARAAALEQELDEARDRLKAQRAAADALQLENQQLATRLRAAAGSADEDPLKAEVEALKRDLATARTAASAAANRQAELASALAAGRTDQQRAQAAADAFQRELAQLRELAAAQGAELETLRRDNEALGRRVAELATREVQPVAAAVASDADRARIQRLEAERDQLRQELALVREQSAAREDAQRGAHAGEVARLQGRVDVLESHVAVLAARAEPYTDEERALFQEPAARTALPAAGPAAAAAETRVVTTVRASEVIAASVEESLAGALPADGAARAESSVRVKARPGPAIASVTPVATSAPAPTKAAVAAPVAPPPPARPLQLAQADTAAPPAAPPPAAPPAVAGDATNQAPAAIRRRSARDLPPGAGILAADAQRAFARRQLPEAEAKYREILRLDEQNVYTLANLAAIQIEQGKLPDAEAHLRRALDADPEDSFSLSLLGIVRFRQERYEDAFDLLSRAARLDPENAETQNYLGITLSQKGQRAPAEAALRRAIKLNPVLPSAHYNLAVVYATQKPPFVELARFHYDRARRIGHPANPALERVLDGGSAPAVN